jgi:hypothetical protein
MAHVTEPAIAESSTTGGAGPWALAGPLTRHAAFSSKLSVGGTFWGDIEAVNASGTPTGDWVEGLCTYSAADEVTLTTPYRGSGGDSTAVDFGVQTVRIRLIADARQIAHPYTASADSFTGTGFVEVVDGPNFYQVHARQKPVATPTFSPVAGDYSSTQSVTISCATTGAAIRYTTDGSTPDGSSTLYSGAISVSVTTTVKAIGILSGYANSAVGSAAYTFTDVDAAAWAAAVTSAGGTYSAGTLAALSVLIAGLKTDSIWTKVNTVFNPLCGNQLTAALIQLKSGTWAAATNNNFVSGDYTEATGLTPNGSSKYLNTGFQASSLTANSTHIAVYNRSSSASAVRNTLGADDGAGNRFLSFLPETDHNIYDDQYNNVNGRLGGLAAATPYGFLIGSRTASNAHAVYRNGSSLGTNATSGGSLPAQNVYVCAHNNNGAAANFGSHPIALYSFGAGLTSTEAGNYNTRVQTFQTSLGRNV